MVETIHYANGRSSRWVVGSSSGRRGARSRKASRSCGRQRPTTHLFTRLWSTDNTTTDQRLWTSGGTTMSGLLTAMGRTSRRLTAIYVTRATTCAGGTGTTDNSVSVYARQEHWYRQRTWFRVFTTDGRPTVRSRTPY